MPKILNDITSQNRGSMFTLVPGQLLEINLFRLARNNAIFVYKCGSKHFFDLRDEFRAGTFMIHIGYLLFLEELMVIRTGSSHMGLCKCYIS